MQYEKFTNLLIKEVTPALGCTAPISVAIAAARCREELTAPPQKIQVILDPGIYKNGWGISIPGTTEKGNSLGAALGIIAGKASLGLNVLNDVTSIDIEKAIDLVNTGVVSVECDRNKNKIYISVTVQSNNEKVHTLIEDTHTNW